MLAKITILTTLTILTILTMLTILAKPTLLTICYNTNNIYTAYSANNTLPDCHVVIVLTNLHYYAIRYTLFSILP